MKHKNKGISLIYLLIICCVFSVISTSILVYSHSKIEMLNNIDKKVKFRSEVIKDLSRNEKNIARSLVDFNKLSKKISYMYLELKDIKNIECLNFNSYFDTEIINSKNGYIFQHLIFNKDGESLGGYKIKNINNLYNSKESDVIFSKKIGDYEVLKKEKIKFLSNDRIKVKDMGFVIDETE